VHDRRVHREFSSFDEFKNFFYSFFDAHSTSFNEIDRLILEEGYKDTFTFE